MYRVQSVNPAGGDWWEIRIAAPNEQSIPMRQCHPGATREEMLARAESWCRVQNKDLDISRRVVNKRGSDGTYRHSRWLRTISGG